MFETLRECINKYYYSVVFGTVLQDKRFISIEGVAQLIKRIRGRKKNRKCFDIMSIV